MTKRIVPGRRHQARVICDSWIPFLRVFACNLIRRADYCNSLANQMLEQNYDDDINSVIFAPFHIHYEFTKLAAVTPIHNKIHIKQKPKRVVFQYKLDIGVAVVATPYEKLPKKITDIYTKDQYDHQLKDISRQVTTEANLLEELSYSHKLVYDNKLNKNMYVTS